MAEELSGVPYGAYHISANPGQYQPQFAQNFEFIFPDFGPLLRDGRNGNEEDAYVYDVGEKLRIACISADVPSFKQNIVPVRRGNSVAQYAGTIEWQPISIKFNSFENASTKDAVLAWRNLTYNVSKDSIPSLAYAEVPYKQTCLLQEFSGDYRLQRTWKLINAFPYDVKFSSYNAEEQNGKITIDITLAYDRAELI